MINVRLGDKDGMMDQCSVFYGIGVVITQDPIMSAQKTDKSFLYVFVLDLHSDHI